MSGLTALVLGGSGEVGKQLVKELVGNSSFSRVVLVTRRELDVANVSDKVEQKVVDFDKLEEDFKEVFSDTQVSEIVHCYWLLFFYSLGHTGLLLVAIL